MRKLYAKHEDGIGSYYEAMKEVEKELSYPFIIVRGDDDGERE